MTDEQKQYQREYKRKRRQDPAYIAQQSANRRVWYAIPENGDRHKAAKKTPAARKQQRLARSKYLSDPAKRKHFNEYRKMRRATSDEVKTREREWNKRRADAIDGRCKKALAQAKAAGKRFGFAACIATWQDLAIALIDQQFCCSLCGNAEGKRKLHCDHCHKTGKFRSWLCEHCNKGLGAFKDNPELMRRAASYVVG